MAVHAGAHNEPWKVVTNTGEVFASFTNGREALAAARFWRRMGESVQAVRA